MFTNKVVGPLIFYALTLVAGIIFLVSPPGSFYRVGVYTFLYLLWGTFYVVGSLVGGVTVILKKSTALNDKAGMFFEISGLSLISSAHLVYSFALMSLYHKAGDVSVAAVSILILGSAVWLFTGAISLIWRSKEVEEIQESIDE